MAKSKSQPQHLLLHRIIGALSLWGSTVRVLLIGFLMLIAELASIADGSLTANAAFQHYALTVGALLLFDIGYVMIARTVPVPKKLIDSWVFLGLEALITCAIILPFFAVVPSWFVVARQWIPLVVAAVLVIRFVVGVVLGRRTRK